MSEISTAYMNNRVGPIMRHGELAVAVAEAAETDNPGKTIVVEDKLAYLRIQTDDELVLTRADDRGRCSGDPFAMNDLEVELASFAGRIDTQTDHVRFYYAKRL